MKQCLKCHNLLPLDNFYAHPQMADGHLNKCKECAKKDVKSHYSYHREECSEYERNRNLDPVRREKKAEYQRRLRAKSPEKYKARTILGNAVRDGLISKLPCEYCGHEKVQAHHHDYSKPMDVTWLCFKCHREYHHGQEVVVRNF